MGRSAIPTDEATPGGNDSPYCFNFLTQRQFKHMLDVAHPKRGDTRQLPLMSDTSLPEPEKIAGQGSLFDGLSKNEAAS
jgi:hypothetical protein